MAKKPTRKEVVEKMAKMQRQLEQSMQNGETGRHALSVWIKDGVISKVNCDYLDSLEVGASEK